MPTEGARNLLDRVGAVPPIRVMHQLNASLYQWRTTLYKTTFCCLTLASFFEFSAVSHTCDNHRNQCSGTVEISRNVVTSTSENDETGVFFTAVSCLRCW